MGSDIDRAANSGAPNQPPPPILSPSIEGNENGESGNSKSDGKKVQKTYIKPEHWTKYVEAICGLALVCITYYYTNAAFRQAAASETAANAARDSVTVATRILTETQTSNARQALLGDEARKASESASSKSLQATIDNFHEEQRAWVGMKDVSCVQPTFFRRALREDERPDESVSNRRKISVASTYRLCEHWRQSWSKHQA
jgi:hypothetical protein